MKLKTTSRGIREDRSRSEIDRLSGENADLMIENRRLRRRLANLAKQLASEISKREEP